MNHPQLAVTVYLVQREYMVGSIDQLMRIAQFQDFIHLPGENQPVTSQYIFVFIDGRDDLLVETDDFNQVSSFHFVQSGFLHRFPDAFG